MDHLTFMHQNGKLAFRIKKALFHIDGDRLTFSIEGKELSPGHWMQEPSFCLIDVPLREKPRVGMTLKHAKNQDAWRKDGKRQVHVFVGPHAHLYTGQHFEPYDVRVRFLAVTPKTCEIDLRFMTPDVQYYNRQARDHAVKGRCKMRRGEMSDMWIPL